MKTTQNKPDVSGARLAPAVGLLLFCDAAVAGDDGDFAVPEPSVLGLLAAAGVVAGAAHLRNKRGKKK